MKTSPANQRWSRPTGTPGPSGSIPTCPISEIAFSCVRNCSRTQEVFLFRLGMRTYIESDNCLMTFFARRIALPWLLFEKQEVNLLRCWLLLLTTCYGIAEIKRRSNTISCTKVKKAQTGLRYIG